MIPPFALLDSADKNTGRLYQHQHSSDEFTAAELAQLDESLARGWRAQHHAVLTLPYDFGRDLIGVADTGATMTCTWYAQQTPLQDVAAWLARQMPDDAPAGVIAPQLAIDAQDYQQVIARIHEHIRAGDAYQINFTTHADFHYYGHPIALYRALRQAQPAPYAALIYHGDARWTLSLSPERFFSLRQRHLVSEPMKGTAPILGDGQDDARAAALAKDEKNRAENLMIVDLLRNDLSKISALFSVEVHHPFAVKAHGQVWQMTSEVHADVRDDVGAADMIRALFPCGSITGAPKRMAMQLIDQLERAPRGCYTGSIGYLDPDGSGCFNIAIRSAELAHGSGRIGVGSGITIDSRATEEYAECQWKIAFLQHPQQPFTLFETMHAEHGKIALLDAHLARLAGSAQDLGFAYADATIRSALAQALSAHPQGEHRVKISLRQDGTPEISISEHAPLSAQQSVLMHEETLTATNPLRRYKTSQRAVYDRAWQQAAARGAFDALVFNENGILLEGGRSSVFVLLNGQWQTPDLTLDILPGIMRAQVLAQPEHYLGATAIHSAQLTRADIAAAQQIVLCNALRGVISVRLMT